MEKTIENLRKRINVRLVNNKKVFSKYARRPTHITHKIFGKIYAAIHEIQPVLTLNKSIYVGFTVLELSKWLVYDLRWNIIKKHLNCYLLIQVVLLMKQCQKMFMKNFLSTNACLLLVTIQKIQRFLMS